MHKKHILHDPGYVDTVNTYMDAILQDPIRYPTWMLTLLIKSNYNIYSNTKYSNYMKLRLKALNYKKIWNNTLN